MLFNYKCLAVLLNYSNFVYNNSKSMEYINQIIETTFNSFDITYCVVVNIATYIAIKGYEESVGIKLKTWGKRVITLLSIIIVGVVYILSGMEYKLLFNSAILAPVFWSWVGKPIVNKLKNNLEKDS